MIDATDGRSATRWPEFVTTDGQTSCGWNGIETAGATSPAQAIRRHQELQLGNPRPIRVRPAYGTRRW